MIALELLKCLFLHLLKRHNVNVARVGVVNKVATC